MNLVWGNDDQDWGDPLVPEGAMKSNDIGGVNLPDLTEVDDRTVFLAENALNAKLFKGTAKDMGMRHLPCCAVELVYARKEVRRFSAIKAKVFLPVIWRSGDHLCETLLLFESIINSARNRRFQLIMPLFHFLSGAMWQ